MIRVPSPAKLNLFLHITGRRDDGYHELQTIFQLIDLNDWLEFTQTDNLQISIDGLNSVDLEHNLIYKATQILKPYAQKITGLSIRVEKNRWVQDLEGDRQMRQRHLLWSINCGNAV